MDTKFFTITTDYRYEDVADLVIRSTENYHGHRIYHMHMNEDRKYDMENIFLNKDEMFDILHSDIYSTLRMDGSHLIYADEEIIDDVYEEICELELNELS